MLLPRVLKAYHDGATTLRKDSSPESCAECGTGFAGLEAALRKELNQESFLFCSDKCSADFESAVNQLNRSVHYIYRLAKLRRRMLNHDTAEVLRGPLMSDLDIHDAEILGVDGVEDALASIVASAENRERQGRIK